MRWPAIERLVTALSGADTWVIVEGTGMLATARASSARRNKPINRGMSNDAPAIDGRKAEPNPRTPPEKPFSLPSFARRTRKRAERHDDGERRAGVAALKVAAWGLCAYEFFAAEV